MNAVIIANAMVSDPSQLSRWLSTADLIIAADGGSRHCQALGIVPDVLIGDMDSTSEQHLSVFREQGVELHRYPRRKDKTDLELALDLALQRGADQIVVFGALGLRWDMTLGNLMILTRPELTRASVKLIDGMTEISLVRGGDHRFVVQGRPGALVSLVPTGETVRGVTLDGFEYPLSDRDMETGSTLGISNVLRRPTASIRVKEGMLFCVVTHPSERE